MPRPCIGLEGERRTALLYSLVQSCALVGGPPFTMIPQTMFAALCLRLQRPMTRDTSGCGPRLSRRATKRRRVAFEATEQELSTGGPTHVVGAADNARAIPDCVGTRAPSERTAAAHGRVGSSTARP
jgi:hypothetical protein